MNPDDLAYDRDDYKGASDYLGDLEEQLEGTEVPC